MNFVKSMMLKTFEILLKKIIKQVIDIFDNFFIFSTKAVLKYFKNNLLKMLFQINNFLYFLKASN